MTSRTGYALAGIVLLLPGLCGRETRAADLPPTRAIAAKEAITPAAPVLPAEVVAALQEGQFAAAQTALAKVAEKAKNTDEATYYAYIQGIAQRLAGQGDAGGNPTNAAMYDALIVILQDTLGLKLVSTKTQVDVVAIDHAEKVTENQAK